MLKLKNKIPSDLQILSEIYKNHQQEFYKYSESNVKKDSNIYTPIDIPKIATHFKTTNNIIFGRLYYSMERKYGYTKEDGSKVCLFTPVCGQEKNCVNLPILISVISGLQQELSNLQKSFMVSFIGVIIALLSLTHSCSQSSSSTEKDKAIINAFNRISIPKYEDQNDIKIGQDYDLDHKNCSKCHTPKN
ncbi:MAG TPA: hypothetical protein VGA28_07790 [Desulfurivibrionaceae bacterium]